MKRKGEFPLKVDAMHMLLLPIVPLKSGNNFSIVCKKSHITRQKPGVNDQKTYQILPLRGLREYQSARLLLPARWGFGDPVARTDEYYYFESG
jgi:hypothetical protein